MTLWIRRKSGSAGSDDESAVRCTAGKKSRMLKAAVFLLLAAGVLFAATKYFGRSNIEIPRVSLEGMHPDVVSLIDRRRRHVESNPLSADAWGNYGMALLQHQRQYEALICFDQATALQPPSPRWPYFAGTILEQSEFEEALARYQKSLSLDHAYVPLLLRAASVLIQQNDLQQARELLNRAKDQPGGAAALVQLMRLSRQNSNMKQAEDTVQSARASNALSRELLLELASMKVAEGQTDEAIALQAESKQLPPAQAFLTDPWMDELQRFDATGAYSSAVADQLRMQGQVKQAAAKLGALARQFPERSRPALNRATLLLEMGDAAGAEKELQALKDRFPGDAMILLSLAYARFARGDQISAEQLLSDAIRLKPDYAPAWMAIAEICRSTNRPLEAIAAYEKAVAATPEDIRIHLSMADLLLSEGQFDEAARRLQDASRIRHDDPSIRKQIEDLSKRLPAATKVE